MPPGGTIGRGVDNNLVLPDDDRTISRLQAIVHITAAGECRLTNRGNVTRVLLNDIPLERGRQVELQDGDVLGIDDYQLLVNDLNGAQQPQAATQAPQPVVQAPVMADATGGKDASTAAIPSEIWDSLAKEFSISDDLSKRKAAAEVLTEANPLTAPASLDRNPEDPLAQLVNDAPLDIGQQPKTPACSMKAMRCSRRKVSSTIAPQHTVGAAECRRAAAGRKCHRARSAQPVWQPEQQRRAQPRRSTRPDDGQCGSAGAAGDRAGTDGTAAARRPAGNAQ